HHLLATQSEDRLTQRPEPRRLPPQTAQEQEQHDAKLGEVQRLLRFADQAEAPWTDNRARSEVAQHGTELQPLEQRNDDDCGRQENRGMPHEAHGNLFTGWFAGLCYPGPGLREDECPATGLSAAPSAVPG